MPTTMPASARIAPTERSMPPVMITAVMPRPMMPTKAQLRATLKRLLAVKKTSVESDSPTKAITEATNTQKVCLVRSWPSGP